MEDLELKRRIAREFWAKYGNMDLMLNTFRPEDPNILRLVPRRL